MRKRRIRIDTTTDLPVNQTIGTGGRKERDGREGSLAGRGGREEMEEEGRIGGRKGKDGGTGGIGTGEMSTVTTTVGGGEEGEGGVIPLSTLTRRGTLATPWT